MATAEWSVETTPKDGSKAPEPETFGDDFDGCLARAKALAKDLGATHRVIIRAPTSATDQQKKLVRDAGFNPAFR